MAPILLDYSPHYQRAGYQKLPAKTQDLEDFIHPVAEHL
jgi:hypothetical protein